MMRDSMNPLNKISRSIKNTIFFLYFLLNFFNCGFSKSPEPQLLGAFNLSNGAPPASLTYSNSPYTFSQNIAISTITPTVTGTVENCVSSPPLPTGLVLSSNTCSITGTPSAFQVATDYTITASNSYGSGTAVISITISLDPPSSLNFSGSPYTFTNGVSIGTISPTYSGTISSCIASPNLPIGLSLSSNCELIGVPTTNQTSSSYTITATNTGGSTQATISITINDSAPTGLSYNGSLFTFTVGVPITSVNPTVTGTPSSYSVSPSLPVGLAVNTTTGQLAGTPTVISASATYTVTATNAGGSTQTTISITINDSAPTGLSYNGSLFTFTVGVPITSVNPTVTGTPSSYSVSPSLPVGLAVNTTTGQLAGTPTVISASATYTVTATNAGGSTQTNFTVIVNAGPPTISYTGSPFTFTQHSPITTMTPTVLGTITSCSISPNLPAGLSIHNTTCVISGTPTATQVATTHTITATNANGNTTTTISLTIGSAFYTIGGTVAQLAGSNTIVIQNNGTDNKSITINGAFTFTTSIASGATYNVTVLTQPSGQNCVVTNPTGTVSTANIADVVVTCTGNSNGALSSGTILNPLPANIGSNGGVTTFVGSPCAANTTCVTGSSGNVDSSDPTLVRFNVTQAITTDGYYLYVADRSNNKIRKVDLANGATTTLTSSVSTPRGITTDGVFVYVTNDGDNTLKKYKISDGSATTLSSSLSTPRGMAIYNNNLYFTDSGARVLYQFNLTTLVQTTVISSGLTDPRGIVLFGNELYISDTAAGLIRKTTIGTWTLSNVATGLSSPDGITTDGTHLYVVQEGNDILAKVTTTGVVSTIAGTSGTSGYKNDSTSLSARFNNPRGVVSDGVSLYVCDRNNHVIRRVQ